jgi:uncharacterized protein (UPF0212 family)
VVPAGIRVREVDTVGNALSFAVDLGGKELGRRRMRLVKS